MFKWQEVKISVNRGAEEGVYAVLDKRGIDSYSVEDSSLVDQAQRLGWGDYFPEFEHSEQLTITCYFSAPLGANELKEIKMEILALSEFGFEPGSVIVTENQVNEDDWADAWKAYYRPLRIGQVHIRPSWEASQEDISSGILIKLDPGMAFGAGTHPTTAMCIEILQDLNLENKELWDIGAGSGILSIVAAKLGANVKAVDIDPVAVRVAKENREMNEVDFTIKQGSLAELSGKPHIIVANIIADVIGPMFPSVYHALERGGYFIASGIIEERDGEIISLGREAGLRLLRRIQRGEWVSYLWQRGE